MKQNILSRLWVLLWKDYGWFLIELSIFYFFDKFHRSGTAIIFSFWTITEHVSYASKKVLIKQKTSSTWYVLLWKDYGWFLIELSIFDFSSNLTGPDLQYLSASELSQSMLVIHQKHPNQAKDLINMVCVTLEGLWMVSDRIVVFRFFIIFDSFSLNLTVFELSQSMLVMHQKSS